jgi:hypothetical protein
VHEALSEAIVDDEDLLMPLLSAPGRPRLAGGFRRARELPGTEPVVMFTASLLGYLTLAERFAFTDQLHQIAERRSLSWIFAETPALVASADPGLAPLASPVAHRTSLYLVEASLYSGGQDSAGHRDNALLGLADPYLRWLALARNPADDFGWLEEAGV